MTTGKGRRRRMRLRRRRSSGWWLAAWSCHLSAFSCQRERMLPSGEQGFCLETPYDVGGVLTHSIAKNACHDWTHRTRLNGALKILWATQTPTMVWARLAPSIVSGTELVQEG